MTNKRKGIFVPMITAEKEGRPFWWCNTHQREATEVAKDGRHRCDSKLAGITMPCSVVDLANKAIIE